MASLRLRGKRWWGKVRVPTALVERYGKTQIEKNLRTSDRKAAEVEAAIWEAMLKMEWANKLGSPEPEKTSLRAAYQATKAIAESGELAVEGLGDDPLEAGLEHAIGQLADQIEPHEPTALQAAQLCQGQCRAVRHSFGVGDGRAIRKIPASSRSRSGAVAVLGLQLSS